MSIKAFIKKIDELKSRLQVEGDWSGPILDSFKLRSRVAAVEREQSESRNLSEELELQWNDSSQRSSSCFRNFLAVFPLAKREALYLDSQLIILFFDLLEDLSASERGSLEHEELKGRLIHLIESHCAEFETYLKCLRKMKLRLQQSNAADTELRAISSNIFYKYCQSIIDAHEFLPLAFEAEDWEAPTSLSDEEAWLAREVQKRLLEIHSLLESFLSEADAEGNGDFGGGSERH